MRSYPLRKPLSRSRWATGRYPTLLVALLVLLALSGQSWDFRAHDHAGQPDHECTACQFHKIVALGFVFSAAISVLVFSGQLEVSSDPFTPRISYGSRSSRGPPA